MACYHQVTGHYLSQNWPKSMSPYGVTTRRWVYLNHDDIIKWEHFPRYWPFFAGNSPVNGEFPQQRPVTQSFGVFFDLRLNRQFSTQS